jgi:N-acetylglucosamine malate deacetylase 2
MNCDRFRSRCYKTLIVVAHPDDESIGCGFLLQRHKAVHVVFCTDGAPISPAVWFDLKIATRQKYGRIRTSEAVAALKTSGANAESTFLHAQDGLMHRSLGTVYDHLKRVVNRWRPDFLLTHAYEGGHPDHDCCSFIIKGISCLYSIEAWEMPLYFKKGRELVTQQFLYPSPDTIQVGATVREIAVKERMFRNHTTQMRLGSLSMFDYSKPELFRVQQNYDYNRKPCTSENTFGVGNIPISRVLAAFAEVAQRNGQPARTAAPAYAHLVG